MKRTLWLCLSLLSALLPSLAHSHALQPGYLELRALGVDTWQVLWRKPDVNGAPMPIDPRFGEPCDAAARPPMRGDGEGFAARWTMTCPGGLEGVTITIDGLERTQTDVLVRYELTPGEGQAARLVAQQPAFEIPISPGALDVAKIYAVLGVEHILFGLDHLLFVLALLLLIRDMRRLVLTITAFTVAHSITLGVAALDVLAVPGPPVEAAIALSIMFVAAEVRSRQPDAPRLSERLPWLIAFLFGLLHGLGFGSALQEIGLPQNEVVLALLAFNIGVEFGQIAFVLAVSALWWVVRELISAGIAARGQTGLVYTIGALSAFWFVERIAAF